MDPDVAHRFWSLGRTPYLRGLLSNDAPETRTEKVFDAIRSVGRVLVLGVIVDVIYQWRRSGGFLP